ncbi:MAG: DUF2157 domain-containing protein [Chitinophagaceae bacterium]|nr:DUF2157 domain-containing protein [Chitinophagaceae bacterium]
MKYAKRIHENGIINDEELRKINAFEAGKLFSVHWELRTILYLGVLLLSSGIGVLLYKNIETIGHQVIIISVAIACFTCFFYAFKNAKNYSPYQVKQVSPFFDYIILLACLLLVSFVAYIQFQYSVFGAQYYWLATMLPSVALLFCAYYFDHKGILSIAITGLASTIGLRVVPIQFLDRMDFDNIALAFTGIAFGVLLFVWAILSVHKSIKKHFDFTYHNFAINLIMAASLVLLFENKAAIILMAPFSYYYIRYAIKSQSFWFLLLATIYSYIAITYTIFSTLLSLDNSGDGLLTFGMFYTIGSCAGVILFFINHRKILGLKK